jgi:outer membrane protein insertion porin family
VLNKVYFPRAARALPRGLTFPGASVSRRFSPRFGFMALLALLGAFPLFSQEPEWYINKPIQALEFTGLLRVDPAELREVTDPYVGQLFTDELFNELLGRLYRLDYFETISPSARAADGARTRVIIAFDVRERPCVAGIYFQGNTHIPSGGTFFSWFTGNTLSDSIGLEEGDILTPEKLRRDEAAIRNAYLEEGFTEVRVRSESRDKGEGTRSLTFIIDEGKQSVVSEVKFEGNTVFSSDTLRERLSTREGRPFREAKLAEDRDALPRYYHDRGYIDAELTNIVRAAGENAEGGLSIAITFTVSEGPRYTLGGISFTGNTVFSAEALSALLQSEPGQPVNAGRVQEDMQRVMDAYYDKGYIYNSFNEEALRDGENLSYFHVLRITEREPVRIGDIRAQGNTATKTEVILREIPLRPGDIFSKSKLLEGIQNLYKLQYFSSVTPEMLPGEVDGIQDIIISVEEQSTQELQFGITMTPDPKEKAPFRGIIKWGESNLNGTGNKLQFGAEASLASLDYQAFTVQYNQGWLFDRRLPLTLDLSVIHEKTWTAVYDASFTDEDIADEDNQKEYEKYPVSAGLSTGHTWRTALGDLGLYGGLRSGVEYDEINFTAFDPVLRDAGWTTLNSLWTALWLDTRDISYDPSCGYYAVQRITYNGVAPADRERYLRTDTKLEGFITFLKIPVSRSYDYKAVFAVHSGLAFIFPQPGRDLSVELTHKPAVDGMFTGRGWAKAYYSKGRVLFENWAEIRLPVIPGILALDFFLDAAAVSSTPNSFFNDFTADDFLYSCGAGPRVANSAFPLRFLAAKRFRMKDGEILWQDGPFFKNNKPNSGVNLVLSFVLSYY